MKKWILWLGGLLLALGLGILGRDGRALRRVERQRDELLATGTGEHRQQAERLNEVAAKKKAAAEAAARKTQEELERLDEQDHDMGDLLSRWRSERLRQQQD